MEIGFDFKNLPPEKVENFLSEAKKDNKLPIVLEPHPLSENPKLPEPCYFFDPTSNINAIISFIKEKLNLKDEEIYVFMDGISVPTNLEKTISSQYQDTNHDGFLYMTYSKNKCELWNFFKARHTEITFLGQGGFGKVYKYQNSITKEFVAVKSIPKSLYQKKKDSIKYFNRGITNMHYFSGLKSVVQLKGNCEDEQNYYLILELCDGDMEKYMDKRPPLSPEELCDLFSKLNPFFQKMNELQIIHRDLKPENIMYTNCDSGKLKIWPKIGSFTLSKDLRSMQEEMQKGKVNLKNTVRIGSPLTMAPEVYKGEDYDETCDLWSIGITMYLLLNKTTPFDGDNVTDIKQYFENIQTKLKDEPTLQYSEDEDLNDLMNGLIRYDPKKRFKWSDYFGHKFFQKFNAEKKDE